MSDRLFDLEPVIAPRLVAKKKTERDRAARVIGKMHAAYGHGEPGATCGACAHLVVKQFAGRYFKCALYGNTASAASDWRKSWPACGRFSANEA